MSTIAITGSTDGIGLATARRLLGEEHRVVVHARNADRGRAVLDGLEGDVELVTGDLCSLAEVRALADQLAARQPDVLVHNAGVWVRGEIPRRSVDGFETTFAVNTLAPHLLTRLIGAGLSRLLWLGSGTVGRGRVEPERPGGATDPSQAYADSKAADVALAGAWSRRLPGVAVAAVDPGWVQTKLATRGAPGSPEDSATTLTLCATAADLSRSLYWKDQRPIRVPDHVADPDLQDRYAAALDRLLDEG